MSFFTTSMDVPRSLRIWFVVHFVADIVVAVPLIVAPRELGALVDYPSIDPLTARLVGAALVGIGTESLLGRNATRASFQTMLRLKVLWSGSATAGLAVTLASAPSAVAGVVLGIFAAFFCLWSSYLFKLRA